MKKEKLDVHDLHILTELFDYHDVEEMSIIRIGKIIDNIFRIKSPKMVMLLGEKSIYELKYA